MRSEDGLVEVPVEPPDEGPPVCEECGEEFSEKGGVTCAGDSCFRCFDCLGKLFDSYKIGDLVQFNPRDHVVGVKRSWRNAHIERPHAWDGKHVEPAFWVWEDKRGSRCMYVTKIRHRK